MSSRKKPDHRNIEANTLKNVNYRKVVYTIKDLQIVLMSLQPGEDIPSEIHPKTTQFIRIERGNGYAIINKKRYILKDGVAVTIPPNTQHYIKNTSKTDALKLYTLYIPPHHPVNKLNKRQP